jgi:hypothetical protein
MKTLFEAAFTCASCHVTVAWDSATPILRDRIQIL